MSLIDPRLKKYSHGTPITAADLNTTNDAISFLLKYLADNFPDSTLQTIHDLVARAGAGGLNVRLGTVSADGGTLSSGAAVPDYTDARYYVYPSSPIAQINWDELVETQLFEEIPTSFPGILTATNLAELPAGVLPGISPALYKNGMGTHNLVPGTRVVLIGYPTQFDTTLVHWMFFHCAPVAWLKITKAFPPTTTGPYVGGGGYYNAQLLSGVPVTIDPTTSLVTPIDPAEAVTSTDPAKVVAENMAETNLGNPGSHWVAPNIFVPAWYIGMSNETMPRPVFRFYSPRPGPAIVQIDWANPQQTSGRYRATLMIGSAVTDFAGATPFSPFQIDNHVAGAGGQIDGDDGTNFPTGGESACWFCNLPEAGTFILGGTHNPGTGGYSGALQDGGIGLGEFVGMDSGGFPGNGEPATLWPVYYGVIVPNGNAQFVALVSGSGDYGNATNPPTLAYFMRTPGSFGVTPPGGAGAIGTGVSTLNDVAQQPVLGRSLPGAIIGPALFGLAACVDGFFMLILAFEDKAGWTGSFQDVSLATHQVLNGLIIT